MGLALLVGRGGNFVWFGDEENCLLRSFSRQVVVGALFVCEILMDFNVFVTLLYQVLVNRLI